MDASAFPPNVLGFFRDWQPRTRDFTILVFGEGGSGKTSLINNLLGKQIAQNDGSAILSTFQSVFQGVPVTVHEARELENPDFERNSECKEKLRSLLSGGCVDVIIYCFNATEVRMRDTLTRLLQDYHRMGLDWSKTVIALTFADNLPVTNNARQQLSHDPAKYFDSKVLEWRQKITRTLTTRVEVPPSVVDNLKLSPVTGEFDEALPNHKLWFAPMWSLVLDAIKAVPTAGSHESAMLQQPKPQPSPTSAVTPGYQPIQHQPSSTPSKGYGSRDGLLRADEAGCSGTAFGCIAKCFRACANVCKSTTP